MRLQATRSPSREPECRQSTSSSTAWWISAGELGVPEGRRAASATHRTAGHVLILDEARWHNVFDPLATARPDLVSTQVHTALDHVLPNDPAAAYTQVTAAAHNLEARSAGAALIGDNLAAALDAARADAAYARVLFLFLGLPAAVVAVLLTATVVDAEPAAAPRAGTAPRQGRRPAG
jgi:putative ABC transport system permease protein